MHSTFAHDGKVKSRKSTAPSWGKMLKVRLLQYVAMLLFLTNCGPTVSSVDRLDTRQGGLPYTLPKGLVPIVVFVDSKGVGITIEPPATVVDSEVGTLVARLAPNPFNDEDIKINTDEKTGFLTTVSSESTAQLLAIAEEAAKAAEQLSFQNAQAEFLKEKVVVMQDSFDPLSKADIHRINKGMQHALRHAARAYSNATGTFGSHPIRLRVTMADGSDPFRRPETTPNIGTALAECKVGICGRTMTTRVIRIDLGDDSFGGHIVNVPERRVIPVPFPSTVFADQTISATITNGILTGHELKRDSEALGLVQVPGKILAGVITGFTQGITDETTRLQEQEKLIAAQDSFNEKREASLQLQNEAAQPGTSGFAYLSQTMTVYPFSNSLNQAVQQRIQIETAELNARIKAAEEGQTSTAPGSGGDLLGDPENAENE